MLSIIKNSDRNRFFLLIIFVSTLLINCTPYKFASVRYDGPLFESRMKEGASHFIIQFMTSDGKKAKMPIEAFAYVYYKNSERVEVDRLTPDDAKPSKFSQQIILGNNFFGPVEEEVDSLHKDSKPLPVGSYILFKPVRIEPTGHICYEYETIIPGEQQQTDGTPLPKTRPCPPAICRPQTK